MATAAPSKTKPDNSKSAQAKAQREEAAKAPPAPVSIIPWKNENLPQLSKGDAGKIDEMIFRTKTATAILLYLILKRKGFVALGYDTFDEYVQERHNISPSTGYETVARVEKTLIVRGIKPSTFNVNTDELEQIVTTDFKILSVSAARTLGQLGKNIPAIQQAFAEAEAAVKNETKKDEVDPALLNSTLKGIVRRLAPKPDKPEPAPRTEPTPPAPNTFDNAASGQPALPGTVAPELETSAVPVVSPETMEANDPIVVFAAHAATYNAELDQWELSVHMRGALETITVASSLLEV